MIIYHVSYKNHHPAAVIGKIELLGYIDNEFYLILHPINDLTKRILEAELEKSTITYKKFMTGMVFIKINTLIELQSFLISLSKIDIFEPELQEEICEHYKYFKSLMADEIKYDISDLDFKFKRRIHMQFENLGPLLTEGLFNKILALVVFKEQRLTINQRHAAQARNGYWRQYDHKEFVKRYDQESRQLSLAEDRLYKAIKYRYVITVRNLLTKGVDPNLKSYAGDTPILFCVRNYISTTNKAHKREWYDIIEALLYALADPEKTHLHFDSTPLSMATEHGCTELVDLLLKHMKRVEFRVPEENKDSEVLTPIKAKLAFFAGIKKPDTFPEVCLVSAAQPNTLIQTEVKCENKKIDIFLLLTSNLIESDIECLFNLYEENFTPRTTHGSETNQKHFREKFGLDEVPCTTYIDLIKVKEKIVGFNLAKIYTGVFKEMPYHVVYGSLAYIAKEFRGLRMMSLLGFRLSHALKLAHADTSVYIFYDAIHPNSFRLGYQIRPSYPRCRTKASLPFIREITTQIYGANKANQYDGVNHFYWPTDSRVQNDTLDCNKYDFPAVISMFNQLSECEGGVPMCWEVTRESYNEIAREVDQALGTHTFDSHVKAIVEPLFGVQPSLEIHDSHTKIFSV